MSDHERRLLDDDLPVSAPQPAPKAMSGRAPVNDRAFDDLRERLLGARSLRARRGILATIERRYGTAVAARLADEVPPPGGVR